MYYSIKLPHYTKEMCIKDLCVNLKTLMQWIWNNLHVFKLCICVIISLQCNTSKCLTCNHLPIRMDSLKAPLRRTGRWQWMSKDWKIPERLPIWHMVEGRKRVTQTLRSFSMVRMTLFVQLHAMPVCKHGIHSWLCRSNKVIGSTHQGLQLTAGLQLSQKGHKQAFISYSYALTPLMDAPVRAEWKTLTAEGLECQHIRCHQLQKGDILSSLVTKYKKSLAVAVILVNTEDSFQLPQEFKEDTSVVKKVNFPMVLITLEDGKSLREFLNRYEAGELHARIHPRNMPQVALLPLQSLTGATYSPSMPQKHRRQGWFVFSM